MVPNCLADMHAFWKGLAIVSRFFNSAGIFKFFGLAGAVVIVI